MSVNVWEWIRRELEPAICTSDTFIYDDMDSQSGKALPIIYQPFDAERKPHWCDRGALFDYLFATCGEDRRLLDFGPGDGWPSLIVAPYVKEVIGVDASRRRVEVCAENAARLGLSNTQFLCVERHTRLPFAENSFDGAMAATSVEQTPSPKATLAELFRVLRPGGRLRMAYESLAGYRGGREQDLWLWPLSDSRCRLILFDRHVEQECVIQYGLTFALSEEQLREILAPGKARLELSDITVERLKGAISTTIDARTCTTIHPSARTWMLWLEEAGFRQVIPSHSGSRMAGALYDELSADDSRRTIEAVDDYLRPIVRVTVHMPAPVDSEPMLTAIK